MENAKASIKLDEKQREYLNSLVCQRLSADKGNEEFVQKFVNKRNSNIAAALHKDWNKDKKDKVAYYIVKDPKLDVPMFFFSIRCGEMHMHFDPEKAVKSALMVLKEASRVSDGKRFPRMDNILEDLFIRYQCKQIMNDAEEAVDAADLEVEEWAKKAIEQQLVDGVLPQKAWDEMWRRLNRALGRLKGTKYDQSLGENNIVRTKKSYAAVELVHFCAYDNVGKVDFPKDWTRMQKQEWLAERNPVLKRWLEMGMGGQSMGETLFWEFVAGKIQEVRDLVGCEYIYLFAADDEGKKDGELIRYYRKLGFDFRPSFYVTKPMYDFECYFMCQEVTALRNKKNAFFKNYNLTKEPQKTEESGVV